MKIFCNVVIAIAWLASVWVRIAGSDVEAQRMGAVMAMIILCIFCAKELIIYEIEKLKTPSGLKGESNSTGEK